MTQHDVSSVQCPKRYRLSITTFQSGNVASAVVTCESVRCRRYGSAINLEHSPSDATRDACDEWVRLRSCQGGCVMAALLTCRLNRPAAKGAL